MIKHDSTPVQTLRSAVESAGFTITGMPDDLSWEQVGSLTRRIDRELTRHYSPEVGALLDAGDVQGAARAFMDHLEAKRA